MICPVCASDNIFYSKKRKLYFCEDCDAGFETPSQSKGMRIFVSYGHDKNAGLVSKIKTYLVEHGYDVWIDTSQIPQGADWRERITNGIISSNGILSFLSKHSVRDPGVCIDEIKIAICLKHAYLKTILLEKESEVTPPKMVANTQWIDLSDWEQVPEEQWQDYFESKMQAILDALNSDDAVNYNADIELLTKRLAVFDNTTKEEHLLKQIFVGRRWLAETVHDWMQTSDNQTMMIYGVPGSGKSAFAANLSQYNPNVIGSIFFEWNNSALTNVDYVIRLLALKLAARLPDYRRILHNILKDAKEAEKLIGSHHGSGLFDLLVLNPLQCSINGDRDTCVFVLDGLDETTDGVSQLLFRKARQLPSWMKMLFTSRFEETTASQYDADSVVCLDQLEENNEKDIETYLCCRLSLDQAASGVIAKKCEGSFMYAKTLCDSVSRGHLSLSEIDTLPVGINLFYYDFFDRLFGGERNYGKAKPFLELLCTEEDLPEELFRKSLKLDKYELWEIRNTLRSLVISGTTKEFRKSKTFKFVHKSIKDWLTNMEYAREYYIDPVNGYDTLLALTDGEYASHKVQLEDDGASQVYSAEYPKWMIKAGRYDQYRDLLLASFNPDKVRENLERGDPRVITINNTYYYRFFILWKWADLLPQGYPMQDIISVTKEMVLFPRHYMVSNFAHRSFQISMLILQHCMDSGRFAPVFFELMKLYKFDAYFRSGASDDMGETRDGWDKYYMTRDAVICLKKCDRKGISVPVEVRQTCEKMKISYHYYWGKEPSWGCVKELFSEPELLKDVCAPPLERDQSYVREGCVTYNTRSLIYYLTHSDEEDLTFIKTCVEYFAELEFACEQAIAIIESENEKHFKRTELKNTVRRITFIKQLRDLI